MQARRLLVLLSCAWAMQAQAGLLDDDEARRQIADLKARSEARFDQQAKAQLDLAGQLERQNEEIARLRGQIETLSFEMDQARKRQQDLYLDLDTRLRKIEPAIGTTADNAAAPPAGPTAPAAPAVADAAAESQAYEAALGQFKAGKYKEASVAFGAFVQKYPDSSLAANAQFWLGNSWVAQRNCYKAIEMHNVVLARFPTSPKAPDALLAIASCQQELGNNAGARRSLENLLAKYPGTPAADMAQQRLKKK